MSIARAASTTARARDASHDWTPDPLRREQVPALDFVIGRVLDADVGSDEKDVKFLHLAMAEAIENIEGTKGLAGKRDAEDMARQYLGAGHEEDDVFAAARREWQAFRAQGVLKALRRELVYLRQAVAARCENVCG